MTTRTTAPRACRARKGPRALVVLGAAATLALLAAGLLVNSGSALAAVGDITEYAVPTTSSTPNYITAGPDGNLWFTESLGNRVAQVTTSGAINEYVITGTGAPNSNSRPTGIAAGSDGRLWFTEYDWNRIGNVTTAGVFNTIVIGLPSSPDSQPFSIAAGPDGNLWFTEIATNLVGKLSTAGVLLAEYPIPTAGSQPRGIVAGPDGNLWVTEYGANKVARLTTAGVFTEYVVPTANTAGPFGISAGADGALWFTEPGANKVARVTTSGTFIEYAVPTVGSMPSSIAAGADGNLWFTEYSASKVAKVSTAGVINEYTIPTTGSGPRGIAAGSDGNLWFTEGIASKVAKVVAAPLGEAAVFPTMTNGAYGGYVTAATIQNTGSAPATVSIAYFDQNGAPVGAGDSFINLPVNASWTVRQDNGNSFPSSGGDAAQAGSAVVSSSQPIAAFVNEFAPGNVGDATSYSGVQVPSGVGTTLYAPTIVNNAYGGYTTGIGLLNQGSSPTNVTITYRDGSGAIAKTQTVAGLAAHAYHALYSGDATLALPSGFAGTATITSSAGQPLGAIVNETGPGGQFSSYDAAPSGSTFLNVPVALNNAFGGYYTGMGIQNTSASAGTVSVTYYDAFGTATVKSFSIPANGSLGVYQGSATDGPATGAYTAVIQSSTVTLAAIVNEVAPAGAGSARQSTSYNTFSAGSASLHLPLVENAGSDPWNTGEGIMNTGTTSTTVTVNYYDTVTGAVIGTAQTQTLAPHAFWGLYQPTGGLPSGKRATAVVTTSSGGQVAVICNESSATTFMSYDGQ